MLKCNEQVFFFFGEMWHIGDEKKGRCEWYKGHLWGKKLCPSHHIEREKFLKSP
jgi:hypothetical protein